MTSDWIVYACLGIGLSSAMLAGVFLAFSDFIMRALIAANPIGAIEAMQKINIKVLRSIFLATFFALVPATIGLSIFAGLRLDGPVRTMIVGGSGIYLLAVILVTIVGNVPMNERLARMAPSSPDTIAYWRSYGNVWTSLNHIRTAGSLLTSACYLLAAVSSV